MNAMERFSRYTIALVVAVVLTAVAPGPVPAGEPTEQLKTQLERVLKTVQDPELKKAGRGAQRRAVRKVADEIFDYADTARRALARHWAQRSTAEREEFVALFADLFEHAYISKVELFEGERVTYLGDTVDGGEATVRTRFLTKQGSDLNVDYKMHRAPSGRWVVYDVLIESVSLIDNYRTQFNSVIQRSSYQDLVQKLKAIQAQLHKEVRRPTPLLAASI
jgi:phospholipid transport system substrate-binding protein